MANWVLVDPITDTEIFLRDLRKSHNLNHTEVSASRAYDDVVYGAPVTEVLEQLINEGYKIAKATRSYD